MPKVSVIVPVYKVEKYLDRCVQSLLNQTLKDIEIILVDDGSPDRCPQMCDEYAKADSRIKVVHKQNAGLGFARNTGLEVATGEYVTYCDSDDWLDDNAYEGIYSQCIDDNLDICCFQHRRVDAKGNKIEQPAVKEEFFVGSSQIQKFLLGLIGRDYSDCESRNYGMSSCMALFRRNLVLNSGVRYPSERKIASEDLVFMVNFVPFAEKVKISPLVYYNYYINPESISQNYSEAKHERLMALLSEIESYCNRHFPKEDYKNHLYFQQLRIFKIILKNLSLSKLSIFKKIRMIRKECANTILNDLYDEKSLAKYPMTERLYIKSMKNKWAMFFILLYKLKK